MSMVAEYFIEDGVHRAVAAREHGLPAIAAILFSPGNPPRALMVALDQLHSPRRSISRFDPRHNYPALEAAMGISTKRAKIPPISLQPLGDAGQPLSIPLAQVQINS